MRGAIAVPCTRCPAQAGEGCTVPGATKNHRRRKVGWFHWDRMIAGEQQDHADWELMRKAKDRG